MATIRKREYSYQIRVSCGYDIYGRQIVRTKTWKPSSKMTPKQLEKELNKQAVLFEKMCTEEDYAASSTKLSNFIEQWKVEYAETHWKNTTLDNVQSKINRINEEIGHIQLGKINKKNIQHLIQSLLSGNEKHKPLGAKTVKNYIYFLSSVLNYAVSLDMLAVNPCNNANMPVAKKTKREIYTVEEAQLFIDRLIQKAPLKYQCYFILMLYSGLRRGEMAGLTWKDIDFDNCIISIDKALYHISNKGTALDTPKSETSNRCLHLTDVVFTYLKRLKLFYDSEAVRLGSKWNENDFVFKRDDGGVLSPLTPNEWLHRFCERENLKYVVPHSFRHLNASLLIESGASVKTVQSCLGHSDASTTLNIYAHAFSKAQAKASEAIANNFNLVNDTAIKENKRIKDK